jgi:hypothetical protein
MKNIKYKRFITDSNVNVSRTTLYRRNKLQKNGGGTMILINKEYTTSIQHITTKKIEKSEAEISLVKIKPNKLPRGYSFCYVACIYIPPKAVTKNNSQKHQEQETDNIAQIISDI